MRKFTFYLLPFAFCLLIACRPAAAPVSISNRPVSINDVPQTNAPVTLKRNIDNLGWQLAEDETRQTFSELRGKVVILDLWATYCPPCVEEIPHLSELQKKYPEIKIVGLHAGGTEDRKKIPSFLEKIKMGYSLAYPQDELTNTLFGDDDRIPQTFVFDRNGKLIKKFVGFNDLIKAKLDDALEQTIKQNG